MGQAIINNNLIRIYKITCLGQFCPTASDFCIVSIIIVRNKSPPAAVEFSKKFNCWRFKMKGNNKSYDEINKYDFRVHYYMHYAIGTKFEGKDEITKSEYNELIKKINNSSDAKIRAYKTYTVGFYKTPKTYVTQEVDKKVFDCLYSSQRYEKNKRNNENRRHIDTYFNQENLSHIPSKDNLEEDILNKVEKENIKKFLDTSLFEKQSNRFFQNIIDNIPIVVIAVQEGADPSSVRESIERAKKTLSKKYKKF